MTFTIFIFMAAVVLAPGALMIALARPYPGRRTEEREQRPERMPEQLRRPPRPRYPLV